MCCPETGTPTELSQKYPCYFIAPFGALNKVSYVQKGRICESYTLRWGGGKVMKLSTSQL